jgi:hypothetical protein
VIVRPSVVRISCQVLVLGTTLALVAVWAIPLDVIQSRAVERAGDDPFARFEALGQAEALTWLLRTTLPIGLVLFWPSPRRGARVARWLSIVAEGCGQATGGEPADSRATASRNDAWVLRVFCLGWAGLAVMHFAGAVDQRTRDWPYYRLNSGAAVLPNISESNRMVIRYLSRATPEDARILILSDQKLFFVSYYLLPRRVYHPMHPEAEFVIPQPDQQRPLPAWRLSDVDETYVAGLDVDYVVEYFEGPDYVDDDRLLEDADWVSFAREWRHDAEYVPPFNVVLRPRGREDDAP